MTKRYFQNNACLIVLILALVPFALDVMNRSISQSELLSEIAPQESARIAHEEQKIAVVADLNRDSSQSCTKGFFMKSPCQKSKQKKNAPQVGGYYMLSSLSNYFLVGSFSELTEKKIVFSSAHLFKDRNPPIV